MLDMRPIYCATRASKKLAIAAAVSLLLATGTALAQVGSPTLSPSLGIPGAGSIVNGTGIPMGATELGGNGLSPGTLGVMPGTSPVNPSIPSTTMMSGSTPSLGGGLSPGVSSPSGFGPSSSTFGITNYGVGGVQSLPGSPFSGSAGNDR